MSSESVTRQDAEQASDPHMHLGQNLFGALIMIAGSVAFVTIAWGMMVAVTSPDGWVTEAANRAIAGEAVTLTSFADSSAH